MSSAFEWNEDFDSGIAELNNQHKLIIDNVAQLCSLVFQNKDKFEISNFLEVLDLNFTAHFGLEEEYMRKYNYEKMAEHQEAHSYFKKTYEQIRFSYFYVDEKRHPKEEILHTYSIHLCRVLNDWLEVHFSTLDGEFMEFLRLQKKL